MDLARHLKSRPVIFTAIAVGVALLLRSIHLVEIADTPFFLKLHTDAFRYDNWARQIVEGDWAGSRHRVFYLGPLYPYFLAVVYKLLGGSTLAACVVQVTLSAASVALVSFLAHRLLGGVAVLVAGLAAALYGMLIFYSGLILGATLIVFLDLLLLSFLVAGVDRPRWWRWLIAGVALGLSACARGNVLLFAPLAALAVILCLGARRWKRWLPACLWLGLSCAATIAPVTLHNWSNGDLVLLTSNAGINLFIGNNAHSDGLSGTAAIYKGRPLGLSVGEQISNFPRVAREETGDAGLRPSGVSAFWARQAGEEIAADPGRWLALLGTKLKYFVNGYEVPNNRNIYFSERFSAVLRLPLVGFGLLLPLAVLGMAVALRKDRRNLAPVLFVVAHLVALLAFFVNGRYRLVIAPVLAVYAAGGAVWLAGKLREKDWKRLAIGLAVVVPLFLITQIEVPRSNFRACHYNLANAQRTVDLPLEAIESYDRTIDIDPGFFRAHYRKGQVLAGMGRVREARGSLRRALALAKHQGNRKYVARINKALGDLGR